MGTILTFIEYFETISVHFIGFFNLICLLIYCRETGELLLNFDDYELFIVAKEFI